MVTFVPDDNGIPLTAGCVIFTVDHQPVLVVLRDARRCACEQAPER